MKRDWPSAVGYAAPVGNVFDWSGDYPMPDWGSSDTDWEEKRTELSALASGRFEVTDALHLVLRTLYALGLQPSLQLRQKAF